LTGNDTLRTFALLESGPSSRPISGVRCAALFPAKMVPPALGKNQR
jgi:hypothetical protein